MSNSTYIVPVSLGTFSLPSFIVVVVITLWSKAVGTSVLVMMPFNEWVGSSEINRPKAFSVMEKT